MKKAVGLFFLGLFGFGLLYFSHSVYVSTKVFLVKAHRSDGTVIELIREVNKHSDGKRSYVYYPLIRFTSNDGRVIEFKSTSGSNPPKYNDGQEIQVLYDPENPYNARTSDFFSLWLGPLLLGILGLVFSLIFVGIICFSAAKQKKIKWLKANGQTISVDIRGVSLNQNISVNGNHSFVITAQQLNPQTKEMHVFESDNIWYDPSSYLKENNIVKVNVFVDSNNYGKYYMDTEFLPKKAK